MKQLELANTEKRFQDLNEPTQALNCMWNVLFKIYVPHGGNIARTELATVKFIYVLIAVQT